MVFFHWILSVLYCFSLHSLFTILICICMYICIYPGEGNGNPLQYSCLENPVDRGAWRPAVPRVTQSRIPLKRLSMHACIGEGNGNPLQYSCLENPRDRAAWWAAVYGFAESQTRLKRLSSSSSSKGRIVHFGTQRKLPGSSYQLLNHVTQHTVPAACALVHCLVTGKQQQQECWTHSA